MNEDEETEAISTTKTTQQQQIRKTKTLCSSKFGCMILILNARFFRLWLKTHQLKFVQRWSKVNEPFEAKSHKNKKIISYPTTNTLPLQKIIRTDRCYHTHTLYLKGLLPYERWAPSALSQQTRDRARSHCPNDAAALAEDTLITQLQRINPLEHEIRLNNI
jgi:hypothetical protein